MFYFRLVCVRSFSEHSTLYAPVVPCSRLATSRFRSEHNQANAFVRFAAGPGMGYGADIAPFLCYAEATAMRATCVQMSYAIERTTVWPAPAALTRLDMSGNAMGDAGAVALATSLQVQLYESLRVYSCSVCDHWTRILCFYVYTHFQASGN